MYSILTINGYYLCTSGYLRAVIYACLCTICFLFTESFTVHLNMNSTDEQLYRFVKEYVNNIVERSIRTVLASESCGSELHDNQLKHGMRNDVTSSNEAQNDSCAQNEASVDIADYQISMAEDGGKKMCSQLGNFADELAKQCINQGLIDTMNSLV